MARMDPPLEEYGSKRLFRLDGTQGWLKGVQLEAAGKEDKRGKMLTVG